MGGDRGRHPMALLHPDVADRCQWGALVPDLTGRHTYMTTSPRGHPCPGWDELIAAFHDHGILPADTWQEVGRKRLARTTDGVFAPAC